MPHFINKERKFDKKVLGLQKYGMRITLLELHVLNFASAVTQRLASDLIFLKTMVDGADLFQKKTRITTLLWLFLPYIFI